MIGRPIPTINGVFELHENIRRTMDNQLQQERTATPSSPGHVFLGMIADEIDDFFLRLDQLAMFDLLATTEAHLRADFVNRVGEKRKDALSREFRKVAKQRCRRVRLDEDILASLEKYHPANKACIGEFKKALKLRNWLAHGRYWTPKFSRSYTKWVVRDNCNSLTGAVLSGP